MELTEEFKELLSGELIMVPRHTFAQEETFKDSPLNTSLKLDFGSTNGKCFSCDESKIDCCTNCERLICKNHAYPLMFRNGAIILNICWNCREILIESVKIKLGNTGLGHI